jgi:hypothetical protein
VALSVTVITCHDLLGIPLSGSLRLTNPLCPSALEVGPPGNGKTLMARAVAGESGVAFISSSAAEFIEMYMGLGAARVRDLFNTVRDGARRDLGSERRQGQRS